MAPPTKVNVIDPATGKTFGVDETEAARLEGQGWKRETPDAKVQRLTNEARDEEYGGLGGKLAAGSTAAFSGATVGLGDAFLGAVGAGEETRRYREANPITSFAAETLGALATGHLPGGAAATETGEGASFLSRLGRSAVSGAKEGAIYGAGSGVSQAALNDQDFEHAISTIGSSALFGAGVGAGAGLLAKGAEIGLGKARGALEAAAERGAVDAEGGKAIADELASFRKSTVDDKLFLATKGAEEREIRSLGKISLEADRAIDRTLRNPKALASKPERALAALQQQEHALEQIANRTEELTAKFAGDATGERLAALQKIPAALERNRAIQSSIQAATKPAAKATGLLGDLGENMIRGQAYGIGASLAGMIPGVGPMLAPIAGAGLAKLATGKLSGEVAAKTAKAVGMFANVAGKVAPVAPVLATKALSAVRYAESSPVKAPEKPKLADHYKARVAEIKSQTMYDQTGNAVMRPEARAKIAAKLAPVRQAVGPIAADRLETLAARRLEFLANRIPRKPDVMAAHIGPDNWQPSDMDMRAFARYASAVEDPIAAMQRVAHGTVTSEDAEAVKHVYPEMFANFQQQVFAKLPELRATLPYSKRLALSIFTGIPVDPALDPSVLSVLQASFESEPGTEGGMQAPQPQPQFGSVKNHDATPSEARQGVNA